ncbi:PREDICTED: uncharacterized protein LOC109581175 [Amphimedon queenslandica]|uniref:Uncharacterized protein n=2 Tax=Amphimedon queenslandica TaxID=400682 RepID=A0AAN0J1I9_AMPQE|nr:PREDICTED: uncharacterized protein LOC109581175 [Amphimedon queenslandica]|eukprot:XP_019850596.1 PREDICTED: uncharacterized protein LOC109581175 [Amphimedon queenslandica]
MATMLKAISLPPPPFCNCCKFRYATKKYLNGFSYCRQCASHQPNKGKSLTDYAKEYQYFDKVYDYPVCQCCEFAFTLSKEMATLFYENGERFDYCYNCAPNHRVSPNDPGSILNHEGNKELLKVMRENK